MSIDALEAAIIADPHQQAPYLVLADALCCSGDPRGELIVVQHALAEDPHNAVLAERERSLRQPFEEALRDAAAGALSIDWRLGFASRITLQIRDCELEESALRVRRVLDDPTARFASELVVRCDFGLGYSVIGAIGARDRKAVRALVLDEELGDWDNGRCEAGTSSMWSKLPNLERLYVRSERALFESIDHPRVARMDLDVAPFTADATWQLPGLRAMDWDPHIESDCPIEVLDVLWAQHLPSLRDLTLRGLFFNNQPLLARPEVQRFVGTLDRLCLPAQALAEDREQAIEQLLLHARSLAHLSRLVVFGFRSADLDEEAVARTRSALPRIELLIRSSWSGRGQVGFDEPTADQGGVSASESVMTRPHGFP